MIYKLFSKRYDELEQEVHYALRELIEKSDVVSKHTDTKVIEVNLSNYTELTILHGELTFMDSNGYQYSVHAQTSLDELIGIFDTIN